MPSEMFGRDLEEDMGYDLDLLNEKEDGVFEEVESTMDLKLNVHGALCACSEFKINGIDADEDDFGDKYDDSRENAQEYGCGNMHFHPKRPTQEILDKYKINLEEYDKIADELEDKLSFGCCGWCV